MIKKTIYIAGKVSGGDIEEVAAKFKKAEEALKERYTTIINPVEQIRQINEGIVMSGGRPWDDINDRKSIMKVCVDLLMDCDVVYLLPDWQQSKGATMEAMVAKAMGMDIINSPSTSLRMTTI